MPSYFRTRSTDVQDTEIAGVGRLAGSGKGGIPVERAAERMAELQDDGGKPLTGKRLEDAAAAWAEAHGFEVKSVKNLDEEKLRVESGAPPIGPSIEELSRAAAERDFGVVEAHAEDPAAAPLTPADLPPQETAVVPEPPAA